MGGTEQQGRGSAGRSRPGPPVPALGAKDAWSRGATAVRQFGVDGRIVTFI